MSNNVRVVENYVGAHTHEWREVARTEQTTPPTAVEFCDFCGATKIVPNPTVEYPRMIDGVMTYACCVSTIGRPCAHLL